MCMNFQHVAYTHGRSVIKLKGKLTAIAVVSVVWKGDNVAEWSQHWIRMG